MGQWSNVPSFGALECDAATLLVLGMTHAVREFLADVAERTPAPGAGAAAGVACALGAALTEMAARFGALDAEAARAAAIREQALRLADADAEAYAPVLAALRLPRDDPTRPERLHAELAAASEVPLAIAELAAEVAEAARHAAAAGKPTLRGDALAGADLAAGAARASARLVEINLASAGDDPRVDRARAAAARAAG
jgi:methenyltetrahydrofolate cyclohydrolase